LFITLFSFIQKPFAQKVTPTVYAKEVRGENIIGAFYTGFTKNVYFNGTLSVPNDYLFPVVATANHIYYLAGNFLGQEFDLAYTTPDGESIQQIGIKTHSDTTQTVKGHDTTSTITATKILLVLTNKGSIYAVKINRSSTHYAASSAYRQIGEIGSVSWKQALGDDVYVLTSNHLWVTKDSSTAWQVDSAGLRGAHVQGVDVDSAQNVYAATNQGLFKQNANTVGFNQISSYTGPANVYSIFIDRNHRIFAGLQQGGMYTSSDNGLSWNADSTGLGTALPQKYTDDIFGNDYCIAAVPGQAQHIYKQTSGSGAWKIIDSSIYNSTVTGPAINAITGDTTILAATSFGVFISADTGKTWVQNNNGISAEFISGIAKPKGGKLLISDNLGIYKQQPQDTVWNKVYPTAGFIPRLALYDDGIGDIYTVDNTIPNAPAAGFILKSTDGGNTWVPDTTGLSAVGGTVFFVDEKGTQHIGNSYYAGTKPSQLWQKPKGGTWAIDTVGFPVLAYSFVFNIASDGKGYLYAGGSFGGKKLMRRSITGTNWQVDTAGIPSSISYFSQLTGGHGDVLGISGLSLYHRGSGTWASIPLPADANFPIVTAACIDSSGFITVALNAASGSGVYITGDAGLHWQFVGLDSANVTKLVAYGDSVYVLTSNMGLYGFSHGGTLPVTLSSIRASQLGKGIQVQWSGYNEVNMKGYDIERSANGNAFTTLGNVVAKNNNAVTNDYTFFDASPINGDNFYRVKAISKDGSAQYSATVKINLAGANTGLLVYPNPITGKTLNIQLNNIDAGKYALSIYNMAGQKLYSETINHPGGTIALAVNMRGAAKGVYQAVLTGNGQSYTKTILIQ